MNEVIRRYKEQKFQKCLELIKSLKESDDDLQNFSLENCRLVCESYIRINENDPVKIFEMQEPHYLFYEKVVLMGVNSDCIPLELKLNAIFNFTYWLLFYTDIELEPSEEEEYLKLINRGLLSVLDREIMSVSASNSAENLLNNLLCLKNFITCKTYKTALLILELVVVIILYVATLRNTLVGDCLKVVSSFVEESKHVAPIEFLHEEPTLLHLFKFSFHGSGSLLSDLNSVVIDCLQILECTLLFLLEDFKGSLKSLQKNMNPLVSSLWNYLAALNSYELGNWDLCSKFLIQMASLTLHSSLKARYHILQGKINCMERKHKEALREFEIALSLSPNCPVIYYYMGQTYGKMGLNDSMVENFEKLMQALQLVDPGEDFKPNFESALLDWIHPVNEITETEALYALAVSYGLNENFKSATGTFEEVLRSLDGEISDRRKRIIELPSYLTILHEASIMNLLLGNLVRAEQISLDAIDRYVPRKVPERRDGSTALLCKDVEWLERVIQQELLDTDLEPKELSTEFLYTEDLLLFFPRNVVALLILSEVQRIQETEEYKSTISSIFTIFSKYLALMSKKDVLEEGEKHALTLVKALAGKTCVRIADIQMHQTNDSSIEKMFKRALSCNKGDRDALYNYYKFLIKAGRNREALKLWNTFSKEKVAIGLDSLQSFSLRYFLTDKITSRDLEKVQREIEVADTTKFS